MPGLTRVKIGRFRLRRMAPDGAGAL